MKCPSKDKNVDDFGRSARFRLGFLVLWACVGSCLPLAAHADADAAAPPEPASAENQTLFEREIAPLLARHCLECHGSTTQEGSLDLSRQAAAISGGDGGPAIEPGDSEISLLWQYVESDEMPQNRAPLSDKQKSLLKRWIDGGAVWSLERIDPDAYVHDGNADELWVQRLTVPEYIATVHSALGVDIGIEAQRVLPRDERADGFANTAYNLGVDLEHIQAYARMAQIIVDRVDVEEFAAEYVECAELNDSCMDKLIRRMGKSVLRGPLSDHEIESYKQLTVAVREAGGDFVEATRLVIQSMLQSPRFIYRIERQSGDGSPQPVDGYELASRLSYILWGAPPDEALMEAAESGRLEHPDAVASQVERMLEDPRAVDRSLQFISEWIDLSRLDALRPNSERFPQWNERLATDMQEETVMVFRELAWEQERPLWELMNAPFTYATPSLAYHYSLYGGGELQGEDSKDQQMLADRVRDGLQLLYTFTEGKGDSVQDRSEAGDDLDLKISDPSHVRWARDGLEIHSSTLIATENAPRRLIDALKQSQAVTLEAWVTPLDTVQSGPARIITLSNGIGARNFTLGQESDSFDVRLRTTKTDGNGMPSLSSRSGTVVAGPAHVVFTRQGSGETTIYVDGRKVGSDQAAGDFGNWDDDFQLAVANELSGDRAWLGTLHLAAIYDRALSIEEVRQNHAAGGGVVEDELASLAVASAWDGADQNDLVSLYQFDQGDGDSVADSSGAPEALDLNIEDASAVRWSSAGLAVYGSTQIDTGQAAEQLSQTLKQTKAFSVEAWVTPANDTQDGPARIVTLSSGAGQRNWTLGQDGNRFDARLRAEKTDGNGMPSLSSERGSAGPVLTHLVLTKETSGQARLFVNGEQRASRDVGADLSSWDEGFRLGIANETSGDRPWQGKFHLLAIYKRSLTPEEIRSRGGGLSRYDLTDNPTRGGLLTQGSVLTIGGDEASMVARGLFVLHDLLYSRVGNPPACVDTTPVPTEPGMSMRDLAEARLADASCTGCHSKFEPLAFGLEKFDGVAAYHEYDEHGNQLREDGEILFPGREEPVSYESSAELMDLLADSDRVRMAITRKLTQFALGRPLTAADLPHLKTIHETAVDNGGTYRALMTAIVMSDLVRTTRTESS